jgi:small-conductance mechanosensitive channel
MFNWFNILIVVLYMLSNGLLRVFMMYKDTNERDVSKNYDNKIIRSLSKLSGYFIIILLFIIFYALGFKITILMFLLGFLGQKIFNIIVHFIIVIPVNVIFYSKRRK